MTRTLGLVASASGGVERIRQELVEPLMADGWEVAITLTPTAGVWLRGSGEADVLAEITGYPVRVESRLPSEKSGHPQVTCYAVVPASANTVAKLALGIADNQALTTVCEALGTLGLPVIIFPGSTPRTRANRPGPRMSTRCGVSVPISSMATVCGRCVSLAVRPDVTYPGK